MLLANVRRGAASRLTLQIHAWWSKVSADEAADNVRTQFQAVTAKFGGMTAILGETGWPVSLDVPRVSKGGFPADAAGLNTFLSDFICQANAAKLP